MESDVHVTTRGKMRPRRYMYLTFMLVGCCLLFTWYSIRRSDRVNGWINISKQIFNTRRLSFGQSKYNVTGDPVDHIAFIKLPKTGSTTAQNIFLRYGDEKNLTFALPRQRKAGAGSLKPDNFLPPSRNGLYDITCTQIRYNRRDFSRVLHKDTKYIGIVREPFSHFRSRVRFFKPDNVLGIKGENPVLDFLKQQERSVNSTGKYNRQCNPMSEYYQFPSRLFLQHNDDDLHKHLQKFGKEMDMILVLEYLDESVVLLRRILNWDLRLVLYAQLRENKNEEIPRLKFGPNEAKVHKNCAHLDYRLYDFFVHKLKELIKAHQPDFDEELAYYRNIRTTYTNFCLSARANVDENAKIVFEGSAWNRPFTITTEHCKKQFIHDMVYLDILKKKHMNDLSDIVPLGTE